MCQTQLLVCNCHSGKEGLITAWQTTDETTLRCSQMTFYKSFSVAVHTHKQHFTQHQRKTLQLQQEVPETLWAQSKHDVGLIKGAEPQTWLGYHVWNPATLLPAGDGEQQTPLLPRCLLIIQHCCCWAGCSQQKQSAPPAGRL